MGDHNMLSARDRAALDRHITGNYGEDQLKNARAPRKLVRWKKVNRDHYRGFSGKLCVFTIIAHRPPMNGHFAVWTLHRGDVGGWEDSPLAKHNKVGIHFDTKASAQAKAEELQDELVGDQ